MNSQLDNQLSSHLDSQFLSLAEYSNKYHVSISTLRRKIRTGKLAFSLKNGKYFLKDQNLISLKQSNSFSASHKEDLSTSSVTEYSKLDNSGSQNISSVDEAQQKYEASNQRSVNISDTKENSTVFKNKKIKEKQISKKSGKINSSTNTDLVKENFLLNKMVDSQKELLKQIEFKEKKVTEQQNRIMELNTLVALLEKENKELKSLLHQEKEMEEWLELK